MAGDTPVEILIATLREVEEATGSLSAGQLADELLAIASIYQPEQIRILPLGPSRSPTPDPDAGSIASAGSGTDLARAWKPGQRLRLAVALELDVPPEDEDAPYGRPGPEDTKPDPVDLQLSVTLPAGYPEAEQPPQLQLLNRFVGAHAVDPLLFGRVLRCFLHSPEAIKPRSDGLCPGLEWHSGEPVLFEALEWAKDTVSAWHDEREEELRHRSEQLDREREERAAAATAAGQQAELFPAPPKPTREIVHTKEELDALVKKLGFVTSATIVDRKSEFVGYACRLEDPDQVPLVVEWLLHDKRVLRAAHPAIFAYSITLPDGTAQRDFEDDGETAAGGRLSHLLSILNLDNVLVIVTRWWGGHLLGPDRFKHINRVARDALERAGFVAPGGGTHKKQ